EAGFAPGRVPESPQVSGVDPVLRQPPAGRGDLGVALAVEVLATFDPRREQPVLLEGAREGRIDTGPVAELSEVELSLPLPQSGRPAALALRCSGTGCELLSDHPQGQKLVPLQPEDRLQALDVLL